MAARRPRGTSAMSCSYSSVNPRAQGGLVVEEAVAEPGFNVPQEVVSDGEVQPAKLGQVERASVPRRGRAQGQDVAVTGAEVAAALLVPAKGDVDEPGRVEAARLVRHPPGVELPHASLNGTHATTDGCGWSVRIMAASSAQNSFRLAGSARPATALA